MDLQASRINHPVCVFKFGLGYHRLLPFLRQNSFSRLLRRSEDKMSYFLFSELCRGKAMVAYTKHQQRKKEENKQLRGERDQIKFIDPRFGIW